jgi:hypothetical protein
MVDTDEIHIYMALIIIPVFVVNPIQLDSK